MAKLDTETHAVLTEGEHVQNLTRSEGWNIVKAKLDAKILDLQNINNLDFTTQESVLFDLKARKMAADLLFTWLRDDVYGFVEQQEANAAGMMESKDDGFISGTE